MSVSYYCSQATKALSQAYKFVTVQTPSPDKEYYGGLVRLTGETKKWDVQSELLGNAKRRANNVTFLVGGVIGNVVYNKALWDHNLSLLLLMPVVVCGMLTASRKIDQHYDPQIKVLQDRINSTIEEIKRT